jgi:hypothetical protein
MKKTVAVLAVSIALVGGLTACKKGQDLVIPPQNAINVK